MAITKRRIDRQELALAAAVGVATGRVGLGLVALVRPALVARPWIGDDQGPATVVLGRALGGRDIALGLGLLLAAIDGRSLRGWTEAAAVADTVDVAATLIAFNRLPARGRLLVLAAAGGAAAAGWLASSALE